MNPSPQSRPTQAELTALRAQRDEIEGQAHQLRLAMKELRAGACLMGRRDQQAAAERLESMRAERAVLNAQAAALGDAISEMMREAS